MKYLGAVSKMKEWSSLINSKQTIQHYSNPSLCPNTKAEKGDVEDLQDLTELTPKKMSFSSQGTGMQKQEVKRYPE